MAEIPPQQAPTEPQEEQLAALFQAETSQDLLLVPHIRPDLVEILAPDTNQLRALVTAALEEPARLPTAMEQEAEASEDLQSLAQISEELHTAPLAALATQQAQRLEAQAAVA